MISRMGGIDWPTPKSTLDLCSRRRIGTFGAYIECWRSFEEDVNRDAVVLLIAALCASIRIIGIQGVEAEEAVAAAGSMQVLEDYSVAGRC